MPSQEVTRREGTETGDNFMIFSPQKILKLLEMSDNMNEFDSSDDAESTTAKGINQKINPSTSV